MNRANLEKLIEFIPTIPDEQFDMRTFRDGGKPTPVCNTVGCIVGHATQLDTPENISKYVSLNEIEFGKWSRDFLV